MATHIIHKQKVVLQVPAQQDAFSYQDRVSKLFNNGLQAAIENVLDEMATPGEVVRIDTLSIDLGVIEAKQFDAGFKAKLVTSLKEAVLKSKAGTVSDSSNTPAETKPAATSQRDAFMYFVLHGSLPWYSNARNMQAWEDVLFSQWQPADWKLVAEWIKARQQQGYKGIQRIVWQFSDAFLAELALYIYGLVGNAESITAAIMQDWHSDITGITSVVTTGSAEVNKVVWMDIFELLLANNKAATTENIIARLVVTQLLRGKENVISHKDALLNSVNTGIVSNVLSGVISALNNNQSISVIAANVFSGGNPGDNKTLAESSNSGALPINEDNTGQYDKPAEGAINKSFATVNSKSGKQTATPAAEDVLYINSCGLVLLHPFLGAYFADLGLIEKKQFINEEARQRAVLLLHYLATGETAVAEFNLVLQKLLCGFEQQETLPASIELSDKEKLESEQLLRTVIDYWPLLKNTSAAGFQQTFLQREGRLNIVQSGWLLRVEQKAVDVLLGKLPWGYSTIRLPWMAGMLTVEWA